MLRKIYHLILSVILVGAIQTNSSASIFDNIHNKLDVSAFKKKISKKDEDKYKYIYAPSVVKMGSVENFGYYIGYAKKSKSKNFKGKLYFYANYELNSKNDKKKIESGKPLYVCSFKSKVDKSSQNFIQETGVVNIKCGNILAIYQGNYIKNGSRNGTSTVTLEKLDPNYPFFFPKELKVSFFPTLENLNEKKNNFLLSKIPKNNKSNNEIVKLRKQLEDLIKSSKDTNSLETKKNIAILEKDLKILESLSASSSVKQTNLLETDTAKQAKVEPGDVVTSVEDIFKKDTVSSKKIKSTEFSNLNFNDQFLIAPGMTAYYFYIGSQSPLKRRMSFLSYKKITGEFKDSESFNNYYKDWRLVSKENIKKIRLSKKLYKKIKSLDGGYSSAYANVDKARKLLKMRLSYYEKNKKFNLNQLINEYVEHTNQLDKKKLIAKYVDINNDSLVAENEKIETKVSTQNIYTAMAYDWMTNKSFQADSSINMKDAEKKALELCKANSCVIHSTQTINDNIKEPVLLTKNETSQSKDTIIKKVSEENEINLTSEQVQLDFMICQTRWSDSNLTTRPNIIITKKRKGCPDGRIYKVVKYKNVENQYKKLLKNNFCYDDDRSRVKIRKKECKDNELYVKYKDVNNEDVFFYEIVKKVEDIEIKKNIINKVEIAKVEEIKPKQEEFKPTICAGNYYYRFIYKPSEISKCKYPFYVITKDHSMYEWHASRIPKTSVKKTEVAKVEEPKQEEFKPENQAVDNDPPVIDIAENITVYDTSYEIKGSVKDKSDKIFIEIDGQPVQVKDGKFYVKRYSPIDEQIKIIAIDQWGNRSKEKLVNIKINLQETLVVEKIEPLNPSKLTGKTSDSKVALIIGIEKYAESPDAQYANLDAQYFFDYARKGFGVNPKNIKILVDEDATFIETSKVVNKWLKSKIVKDKSDLIVFFAGHGLSSSNGKELFLLSQDSDPDLLDITAYSRTKFFDNILKLNPKSVTMFLDTCYSGVSRDEEMLLASARPLRIVAEEQSEIPNNFTIFSASELNQISSGLKEAKHGIFSYYLMKGLEGNADLNNDKAITNGELLAYMDENVSQKAAELGREQNPSLSGDPDKVLISY